MTTSAYQNHPSAAELEALSSAFGAFVKVTEELRASYERLRERAERIDVELSIANEQLRGTLAAIPSGVVVSDVDGRITAFNTAAERILGLAASEAIGRQAADLADLDGKPLLLGADRAVSAPHGERERRIGEGRRVVLGGGLSWVRDAAGRVAGAVEAVEDLTELWELREKIHRLDKLAALGEMSAVIAHEIRNPLNGIQGFADLLARSLSGSEARLSGYAQNIVRGVREVDTIISDLLVFAAPERFAPATVELEPVLRHAADQALRSTEAQRTARIQIQPELPPGGVRIAGDAVKLGQIFRNLFSNAVEAMPEGGRILVSAAREGKEVRIAVQDEGAGIPSEIRPKVFDPFFTTKTQGTGLGLAIVRKLVELHGGRASVAECARGARFELTLPARP